MSWLELQENLFSITCLTLLGSQLEIQKLSSNPISCHWSLSILPENISETESFLLYKKWAKQLAFTNRVMYLIV